MTPEEKIAVIRAMQAVDTGADIFERTHGPDDFMEVDLSITLKEARALVAVLRRVVQGGEGVICNSIEFIQGAEIMRALCIDAICAEMPGMERAIRAISFPRAGA